MHVARRRDRARARRLRQAQTDRPGNGRWQVKRIAAAASLLGLTLFAGSVHAWEAQTTQAALAEPRLGARRARPADRARMDRSGCRARRCSRAPRGASLL